MKQRSDAFDALKLFAIFLVLWGHSIQYYQTIMFYENPVARVICSFHMPLFMMIAGYFSVSSMQMSVVDLIKKKGLQLIVPALIWSLIVFGADYFYGGYHSFRIHIKEDYWFLKSLFVCYLLTWLGCNLKVREIVWIPLLILFTQFVEIWKIPLMYPCFIIGFLLRMHNGFKGKVSSGGGTIILGITFVLCLLLWDQTFWEKCYGIRKTIADIYVGNSQFEWHWLFRWYYPYLIGIVGSLFFIGLFNRLFSKVDNNKNSIISLCSDWGQKTMGVYLIQLLLLETILPNYFCFDGVNLIIYDFIITPLISLAALVTCVYMVKLLEKSKITSILLLGKK